MPYSVKLPPALAPASRPENPPGVSPSLAEPVTAVTPVTPSPEFDPLARLLTTRLTDLRAPLEVASSVLGETIWLVANDYQAARIQVKGGVAYTPEEVAILGELAATLPAEV